MSISCVVFATGLTVAFTPSPSRFWLREKVNAVFVADTVDAPGSPINEGTAIVGSKFVRTDTEARVQLYVEGSVLRIGASSVVQVSGETTDLRLVRGCALYDKLTPQRSLVVRLSDHHQASVSGDTGFVVLNPQTEEGGLRSLIVGAMAGPSKVQVDGKTYSLKPGEALAVSSNGKAVASRFDLMQQIKTSLLLTGFKTPLPGSAAIDREAKNFAGLQRRGFVREPSSGEATDRATAASGSSAESSRPLPVFERVGISVQNGTQQDTLQSSVGIVFRSLVRDPSSIRAVQNNNQAPTHPDTGPGHVGKPGGKPPKGDGQP